MEVFPKNGQECRFVSMYRGYFKYFRRIYSFVGDFEFFVMSSNEARKEGNKRNEWFGLREISINIESEDKGVKESGILWYFKEYCNCSGVHGFRYLSEERRTRLER